MGVLDLPYQEKRVSKNVWAYALPDSQFRRFNSSVLDLGEISAEGKHFEALAAVFDLQDFTSFCNQIDPHLVIPEFLERFLDWLFTSVSDEFVQKKRKGSRTTLLWGRLPFFAKFMGDGVLFLWNTEALDALSIGNIVDILRCVCEEYVEKFLPDIRKSVAKAPGRLRCGIARGRIISIGDGRDFVGPSINVAARIQKLDQFSFVFSKRGFDLDKYFTLPVRKRFVLITSPIRGVGDEELLFALRKEFNKLSQAEKVSLRPK
jgi:class 3 adenylate cyclase